MLKLYRSVLAAGAVAIGLAACGDDVTVQNPPEPTPAVNSVTVAPASVNMTVGQSVTFAASVNADAGLATTVTWSSSDASIATVDGTGKVTAVAVGTTTIVATSTADAGKKGIGTVTVQAPIPGLTSFSVTPQNASIAVGGDIQASAQAVTLPGVTATISWASSNTAVATVTASGSIHGVAAGTAVITATATVGTQTMTATVGVTVTALPPAISSFTVTPDNATMKPGDVLQASAVITTRQGVTVPTPSWSTSNAAVATVSGTGSISAVAPGTAVITASASAAGEPAVTRTIGITVRQLVPATVSINSVNAGSNAIAPNTPGLPVNLNNVNRQIDVNVNFDPGEQIVTKLEVLIGNKVAGTQSFATNPSAGILGVSINTASFVYDSPSAGMATVDYANGPTTLTARITVTGVGTVTATNTYNIVLNNVDGWAAKMTAPARSALTNGTGNPNFAAGAATFWGGPGASGTSNVTLYPVTYSTNRNMTSGAASVTWGVGTIFNSCTYTMASGKQVFGYNDGTVTANCGGYENVNNRRDNVIITAAVDNLGNLYPTGLISNVVVAGSTPDSLRFDWSGPYSVTTPTVAGAEGFNWVNDSWGFNPGGTVVFDGGVGANNGSWTAYLANAFTVAYNNAAGPGAALAETNTNTSTDGYRLRATGMDLLTNASNSGTSGYFGVDRTAPSIRYSATAAPSLFAATYTQGGTTAQADSTTYKAFSCLYGCVAGTVATGDTVAQLAAAAGTNDSVRTEAIDNRSGLSRAVETTRRFAQGGTSTLFNSSVSFGAALVDGWRPAPARHVVNSAAQTTPGYYTNVQWAIDRAGNASSTYKRTVAFDPGQPAVTGVSPNAAYTGNAAAPFTIGAQNDLEVIDASLRMHYPNLTQGDGALTASTGLRWYYGFFTPFATRFDNSIVNPLLGTLTLDAFTVSVQETCLGAASPTANCVYAGDPITTGDIALAKPDSVAATVRDVYGSFAGNFTAGALTGVSNELASPILSATVPSVGSYSKSYDASTNCPAGGVVGGPCVIGSGINLRVLSASGSTRTFRSVQALSVTLPIFTRVDLFGLNSRGEWQFIQRITVPASVPTSGTIAAGAGTITGSDNGFERYWDYAFTSIPGGYTQYRALGVNSSGYGLFSVRTP